MLGVLFCLQIVPSREIGKEVEAETANVYDPAKAVAWATNPSNFIDGDYLCAAFVSYCLQHGGLTDVFFGTPCTLTAYVEQMHYGKKGATVMKKYIKRGIVILLAAIFIVQSAVSSSPSVLTVFAEARNWW